MNKQLEITPNLEALFGTRDETFICSKVD